MSILGFIISLYLGFMSGTLWTKGEEPMVIAFMMYMLMVIFFEVLSINNKKSLCQTKQ